MAETIALTRFCLQRYWRWTALLAGCVVLGMIISILGVRLAPGRLGQNIVAFSILFTFMPAVFFTLAMFDYGGLESLETTHSGCSHWILRMPIRSWKIALVPLVLKTLWMVGLWIAFTFTISLVEGGFDRLRDILLVGIVAVSCGIWFSAVAWRPFSSGWWRLLVFCIVGCLCLASFVSVMMMLDLEDGGSAHPFAVQIRSILPFVAVALPVICYVTGIAYTFHAVEFARTRSRGNIPERASKAANRIAETFSGSDVDVQRNHASPTGAVVWYTLARALPWIKRVAVLWLPIIVACTLLAELHIVTVVMVFGLTIYAGIFVSVNAEAQPKRGSFLTTMPNVIASSPISTARLAWTRAGYQRAHSCSGLCVRHADFRGHGTLAIQSRNLVAVGDSAG